ncbi:HEAT repeat domain-containing protein [Tumebacillus avium]|uniref:HEAT repeat domain-containing protein n=1 Tax=Tumebacillus avium TaxID=1903704 RepID=UPI001E32BF27|nr:HEAT repeat domain-containing protein [Tumebacillus avium]
MCQNFSVGKPPTNEQLKNAASNRISWNTRLDAVEESGKWKCRQSIFILWRRMMSDHVYKVKHRAFLKLQAFGEQVKLPKKKKGNLISGINQKLDAIKNSFPSGHSFKDFKTEYQKKRSVRV